MPTTIALPTGSYKTADSRASNKRLLNCMSEIAPQTSAMDLKSVLPPCYLRRMFGITPFASDGSGLQVRGMRDMGGLTYVVIGPNLYTLTASGTLTRIVNQGGYGTPSIIGSGFVRMTDNTQCLVILIPGTNIAWTYTATTGLIPLTNAPNAAVFTTLGAIDCAFVDSYIVFLAMNGLEFYNDDGEEASGSGQITFLTGGLFAREFGTDPFVGMTVEHRTVLMFGARTSEGYVNVGNATESPFGAAPDLFEEIGMHPDAAYAIGVQDQATFWLAQDLTIRRRNGQTPIRVSNSGIEAILEANKLRLKGCYAMTPTIGGHPLWVLNIPLASRTIAYDCLTTEWFELESLVNSLGYWRPLCWYNALGLQLVGDSQGSGIGYLDARTYTEFGQPMRARITTQSVYDRNNRITHRRVEAVVTPGEDAAVPATAITTGALITLYKSKDSGATFTAREDKSLGALGQRQGRAFWTNLGQARNMAYAFQISDPTPTFYVDLQAELAGGKW
jgi:hypothetical protein